MSQTQTIAKHFNSRATITQLEATIKYRIMRLSERIREMESKGWRFKHVMVDGGNASGAVGRYCRYVLVSRPKSKTSDEVNAKPLCYDGKSGNDVLVSYICGNCGHTGSFALHANTGDMVKVKCSECGADKIC